MPQATVSIRRVDYTDPRQAVEQTRALSVRDAAAATGLSKTTIRRRRNAADPFDVGGLTVSCDRPDSGPLRGVDDQTLPARLIDAW